MLNKQYNVTFIIRVLLTTIFLNSHPYQGGFFICLKQTQILEV